MFGGLKSNSDIAVSLNKKLIIMKNLNREIGTIVKAKTIKGTSFVGVRGYQNKQEEISNQTLLVGYNHLNLLKKDLETIKAFDVNIIDLEIYKANSSQPNASKIDLAMLFEAKSKAISRLEKLVSDEETKEKLRLQGDDTIKRSDAQINAYEHIDKGLKVNREKQQLHIYGLCVAKTILKKGDYKTTKSYASTLALKLVESSAKLKKLKVRTMILPMSEELKIQGATI